MIHCVFHIDLYNHVHVHIVIDLFCFSKATFLHKILADCVVVVQPAYPFLPAPVLLQTLDPNEINYMLGGRLLAVSLPQSAWTSQESKFLDA